MASQQVGIGTQRLRIMALGEMKQVFTEEDIGNFEANENGDAIISFETNLWCINCDDETKNIVGKAVIVHQGQDDFVSQPSGAAGSRVSCAGLIQ